jgi:oxygen-independent coproporphyrinogen-3 oxidase
MNKGIYIHIPFCESKCFYCNFVSGQYDEDLIRKYFKSLTFEIVDRKKFFDMLDTIYFGGGTPSSVDVEHIKKIFDVLKDNYDFQNLKEITIEMNPESTTEEKIQFYKELGFNRFSLGIQSFDDKVLKLLGRLAGVEKIFKVLSLFNENDNLSVDFIYGIKGHKLDISPIKNFPVKHISAYILTLEKGSKLFGSELENDDIEEEYYFLLNQLKKFGFKRYEVSNFSKEGFRSLHNLSYWDLSSVYIGYGVSAASYNGVERIKNSDDIKIYIKDYKNDIQKEIIDENKRNVEYLMLGLRKSDGLDYDEKFLNLVNRKELDHFLNEGYLKIENKKISCTDKGFLILNLILEKILV